MVNPQVKRWGSLFQEKKQALEEEGCASALDVSSLEDLEENLRHLTAQHSRANFPGLLEKLAPGLHHLKSFTKAITTASQSSPTSSLIWGSIQAVVQCACANIDVLDEILDVLSDLNHAIPLFEEYINMFPNSYLLQIPLQDLFDNYLGFCLETIAYIKRRPFITQILWPFWTSKPTLLLTRTRTEIDKNFKTFMEYVALAERKERRKLHKEIQKTLDTDPVASMEQETYKDGGDGEMEQVFSVHFPRNYDFVGREDVFEKLCSFFADPANTEDVKLNKVADTDKTQAELDKGVACCVLSGLGGIGKTQTALEFVFRSRGDYDAIFWVQAERAATLAAMYSAIAEHLNLDKGLGGHDGQDQGRLIKRVVEWFKNTTGRWLIVFDNVEEAKDLYAYIPSQTASRGSIILTTQLKTIPQISNTFKQIDMENFTRESGGKLLFKYLQRKPTDEEEEIIGEEISDIVGGLPLAIAAIGGYINESDYSTKEFLEDMRTSSHAWTAGSTSLLERYDKTLETVFEIALRELSKYPGAREFVNMLAFLNPDEIQEELFTSSIHGKPTYKRADLIEIIRLLRRRQLIRRHISGSEQFLSIHRTVQWNVLLDLSKNQDDRWRVFKQVFELVRNKLPEVSSIDNPEPAKWAQFEKYVPQILSLRTHCLWPEPPVDLPEVFAQVLSDMATFMWHAGLMSQGYDALSTAENIIDDRHIKDNNPLRGNIHEHIGIIASFNGVSQRDESMTRRRKALKARQAAHAAIPNGEVTQEDEIRLWNVQSDMAFGLMQEEDFEDSEKYIERCHDQYKKWGPPTEIPFEYLKYNHIISYVRMSQNRPSDAIKSCKEAVKLGEDCAGVQHPMTQLCKFSLCNHLYLAGESKRALKLSLEVLHARSTICGEYNPFTLESHLMCGFLMFENGQTKEAEMHLLSCLDKRKRSYWNQEGVARAQYIYSLILKKLGRDDEAEEFSQKALKTSKEYLKRYPHYLTPDSDPMVVFDQMVCLWGGRFSGRLAQDGLLALETDSPE